MPPPTPRERRRRRIRSAQEAHATAVRVEKPWPTRARVWAIAPAHAVHESVLLPIIFAGSSLTGVIQNFEDYEKRKAVFKSKDFLKGVDGLVRTDDPDAPWAKYASPAFLDHYRDAVRVNARLRAAFSVLVRQWLLRRRVVAANTEDLVTCEVPRQPVVLVDWRERRRYVFEATTLFRDMRERLLLSDQLFAMPRAPRNPYTNMTLTGGQLATAMAQLRAYGLTHWALEAFAAVGGDLAAFKRRNLTPLKFSAWERLFRDKGSADHVDLMLEFIDDEHENLGARFNRPLYAWALRMTPDLPRLQAWRKLAKGMFELAITISDVRDLQVAQSRLAGTSTEELTKPPLELTVAKNQWHRAQLLAAAQPQPSASPAPSAAALPSSA